MLIKIISASKPLSTILNRIGHICVCNVLEYTVRNKNIRCILFYKLFIISTPELLFISSNKIVENKRIQNDISNIENDKIEIAEKILWLGMKIMMMMMRLKVWTKLKKKIMTNFGSQIHNVSVGGLLRKNFVCLT